MHASYTRGGGKKKLNCMGHVNVLLMQHNHTHVYDTGCKRLMLQLIKFCVFKFHFQLDSLYCNISLPSIPSSSKYSGVCSSNFGQAEQTTMNLI